MPDTFAVFILSHGRANNVKTYKALQRSGYTGKIYILVDDEDKQLPQYQEVYGDKVITFSKDEVATYTDAGDNFGKRNVILYARSVSKVIAERLGLTHHMQLDDDYNIFAYKFIDGMQYQENRILDLDSVLLALCEYLDSTTISYVAFARGGDFIGGGGGGLAQSDKVKRKAMNSFLCRTDRAMTFCGTLNEDVNLYVMEGMRGKIFFTIHMLTLTQAQTQKSKGGLSDIYSNWGTYVKSFYSVMYAPSCVKISCMGDTHQRIHHKISWNNAVPVILHEKHKK